MASRKTSVSSKFVEPLLYESVNRVNEDCFTDSDNYSENENSDGCEVVPRIFR
jgi:hypothetical protein